MVELGFESPAPFHLFSATRTGSSLISKDKWSMVVALVPRGRMLSRDKSHLFLEDSEAVSVGLISSVVGAVVLGGT